MSRTEKERIYDEQISPLVAKIIEICKTNKIATFANFRIGYDKEVEEHLMCTTSLPISEDEEDNKMVSKLSRVGVDGYDVVAPYMAFTITTNKK